VDTHVESHDDVLSDAGSTPAASTIPHSLRSVRCRRRSQPRQPGLRPVWPGSTPAWSSKFSLRSNCS